MLLHRAIALLLRVAHRMLAFNVLLRMAATLSSCGEVRRVLLTPTHFFPHVRLASAVKRGQITSLLASVTEKELVSDCLGGMTNGQLEVLTWLDVLVSRQANEKLE